MSHSLADSIHHLLTPDAETFSTPPTTPGPGVLDRPIAPSLSRRSSRPTSLHIDRKQSDWNPDIQLATSPDITKKSNENPLPPVISQDHTVVPISPGVLHHMGHNPKADISPCFVHSQLDKGAQLTDWLKNKQTVVGDVGVAKSLQGVASPDPSTTTFSPHTSGFGSENESEDDESVVNLTKRLAETAVGVREMSKQLGVCCTFCYIDQLHTDP